MAGKDHDRHEGTVVTQGPVFVAGLERSGTSLLYALLGSHPDIAMTRRTNLWRYVYGQYGDLADPANLGRCLGVMERYKRLVVLELDFEALRRAMAQGPATYPRLFELVGRQVADRAGKPRWGDKSLHTERFADRIIDSYPGARILHMMRDPRDRSASVAARWGRRLGGVGAGAAEWIHSARLALRNAERHPGSYRVVRYESLVGDAPSELEEICRFIQAPWAEEMLGMGGAGSFRESGGNSSYGARTPGTISADSIGRYRSVLTRGQIEFIEGAAGEEMAAMGYPAGKTSARAALARHPVEAVRYAAWGSRESVRRRIGESGVPAYRMVEAEGR